jgi:hypothetical protein
MKLPIPETHYIVDYGYESKKGTLYCKRFLNFHDARRAANKLRGRWVISALVITEIVAIETNEGPV